jgi:hypothetical protein
MVCGTSKKFTMMPRGSTKQTKTPKGASNPGSAPKTLRTLRPAPKKPWSPTSASIKSPGPKCTSFDAGHKLRIFHF